MNIKLGRTFNLNNRDLKGIIDVNFFDPTKIKYFGVRLKINLKTEIYNFDSVRDLIQFGNNKDNFYCFLEYEKKDVFVLEKIDNSNFNGGKNIYNINNEWNLFLNSKGNIVVQQNKSPLTTFYFKNFPKNDNFFIHLSYLYYCLRNNIITKKKDLEFIYEKEI